jgi:beta-glucosidase
LQAVIKTQQLQAVVVYGSPYGLEQLLPLVPTSVPYVFSYGQMPTAQAIALHSLRIFGSSLNPGVLA